MANHLRDAFDLAFNSKRTQLALYMGGHDIFANLQIVFNNNTSLETKICGSEYMHNVFNVYDEKTYSKLIGHLL
jgi:hypothetical protein